MQFDIFFSISQTPVDGVTPDEATSSRTSSSRWRPRMHWASARRGRRVAPVDRGPEAACQCGRPALAGRDRSEHGHLSDGPCGLSSDQEHPRRLGGHEPGLQRRPINGLSRLRPSAPCTHGSRRAAAALHRVLCWAIPVHESCIRNQPRNAVEEAAWPALRGQVFAEACEIFLRLVRGDTLASADVRETWLSRANFPG